MRRAERLADRSIEVETGEAGDDRKWQVRPFDVRVDGIKIDGPAEVVIAELGRAVDVVADDQRTIFDSYQREGAGCVGTVPLTCVNAGTVDRAKKAYARKDTH